MARKENSLNELFTKRELARQLLERLFANRQRVTIAEAVEAGATQDVSRRTLRRAATEMGVREIHNGNRPGIWEKTR
jgi:hypothetical protein